MIRALARHWDAWEHAALNCPPPTPPPPLPVAIHRPLRCTHRTRMDQRHPQEADIKPLIAIASLASAGFLFRHLVHRVARLWERR